MRSPTEIPAPPFPRDLTWLNVAPLRMDKQRGRPVLIEFWDFCRANSLRTLPYVRGWHDRYEADGLRVIGVHTGGYPFSRDEDAVRAAVERLGIEHPVVLDTELQIWDYYGNQGWPARYLWDQRGALFSYHYGEGAYDETEREIQALLGIERPLMVPLRPEDAPGAQVGAPTPEQAGPYSGPYAAGAAWGVFEGAGEIVVNGQARRVDGTGVQPLVEHSVHTEGVLDLEVRGGGLVCHATTFTPGVVAAPGDPAPPAAA